MNIKRVQLSIHGCVQGVGFRPHVYRIATALGLSGWVKNNGAGVLIEIQGHQTEQFVPRLLKNLPSLANIHAIHTAEKTLQSEETDFNIIRSEQNIIETYIPPDMAICHFCLQELFDQKNRFYRYPFINCIYCGPRLTITHQLPYDRHYTSMQNFKLCKDCAADYEDPNNRRYHAQPLACTKCGPQLSVSIQEIVIAILSGKIVAIKMLGGYQLICDAQNTFAVHQLRKRKQRPSKPLAIMMANLASITAKFECNTIEKEFISSMRRPIVLLRKKNASYLKNVAPDLSDAGVMLPYSALHYLLFHGLANYPESTDWLQKIQDSVLVVTSANLHDHPILIDDDLAAKELADIADIIVNYNRKIVTRVDDSVVKIIQNKPFFIRRARGYVPEPIQLSRALPPTLGLGAHLKNTFCIIRGDEAFLSQHIGDLKNVATIDFFHESLNYMLKFLGVKPEIIAHDMHPDFYTSKFAQQFNARITPVQHHHAHLAAVIAEHHLQTPALGLVLDGYGYGTDSTIWGGELFLVNGYDFQRLGCLKPVYQPGGDIAAKQPWRMAVGILYLLNHKEEIFRRFSDKTDAKLLLQMLEKKINSPLTSSCGRLFDAAAAILNVHQDAQYEGEAAMKLESLVSQPTELTNGWIIQDNKLNFLPTLEFLLQCKPQQGANIFHGTLIAGLAAWVYEWSQKLQITNIILGGGCFLNQILTEGLVTKLMELNLKPLLPNQVPINDAGISLGQAWLAGNSEVG